MTNLNPLAIDLADLQIEDVEVFFQEAGKGIPAFAASTGTNCGVPCACSCTCPIIVPVGPPPQQQQLA